MKFIWGSVSCRVQREGLVPFFSQEKGEYSLSSIWGMCSLSLWVATGLNTSSVNPITGLKHATGSGIVFVEKLQMNHFFKYFRNRKELDCLIGPQKTSVRKKWSHSRSMTTLCVCVSTQRHLMWGNVISGRKLFLCEMHQRMPIEVSVAEVM